MLNYIIHIVIHIVTLGMLVWLAQYTIVTKIRLDQYNALYENDRTVLEALSRTRYGVIDNAYTCYKKDKK